MLTALSACGSDTVSSTDSAVASDQSVSDSGPADLQDSATAPSDTPGSGSAQDADLTSFSDSVAGDTAQADVADVSPDVADISPDVAADLTIADAVAADAATDDGAATPQDTTEPLADQSVDLDTDVIVDASPEDSVQSVFLGGPVEVDGTAGYSNVVLYALAVGFDGSLSALWSGNIGTTAHMMISRSTADVSSFYPPNELTQGVQLTALGGDLETDGLDYLVVWRDTAEDGSAKIVFRRASMTDLSGADVVVWSDNSGIENWRPYIVKSPTSDRILIFWQRHKDIVRVYSDDGGLTFSSPSMVDSISYTATLSSSEFTTTGLLVVVFQARPSGDDSAPTRIYSAISEDEGLSFSEPVEVSEGMPPEASLVSPSTATGSDGSVHAVWSRAGSGMDTDSWRSYSQDGVAWVAPMMLETIKSHPFLRPGRGAFLHLSGLDNILGFGSPLYLTSPDDGLTYSAPEYLPTSPGCPGPSCWITRHDMIANLDLGWLHLAWWEWGGSFSKLQVVTIDPEAAQETSP